MRLALEPRLLIICPLAREWSFLVSTIEPSIHVDRLNHLKVEAVHIRDWRALVAPGGHGKTQFAVQAQYPSIDALRRSAQAVSGFQVAFDVIASGDEDVVASERAKAIRDQTGAVCVAWEGSGAARAALFNGIGSLEIRAVTDAADKEAPQRFDANIPIAMANLANLLRLWME